MMAGIYRMSKVLYRRLNEIVGRCEDILSRRNWSDINDITINYQSRGSPVRMLSGSKREGFHMTGSDYDIMIWFPEDHVVCDLSQVEFYNVRTDSIILMDDKHTRPGFVLLQVLNDICNIYTLRSLVSFNDEIYISNSLYQLAVQSSDTSLSNFTLHGPCLSGFLGKDEIDCGFCFASKHWPPQAYCWIERCKRHGWPSPAVLRNIVQNGCHFMAIGAKNSPYELIEWRLSFSQAEHKLVYSFNHCQFVVYGLLKLFLKEVLNNGVPEDNKLLCSYFLKTAVFWEIQGNNSTSWNIENVLFCFWKCYKCLMRWVHKEYCPNFFVPQNNIFFPKITGARQRQLFRQMLELYNEGFRCLLRCSSIHDQLYSAFINIHQPILEIFYTEFDHDLALHRAVVGLHLSFDPSMLCQNFVLIETLTYFLSELRFNRSQTQRLVIYRQILHICQQLAFLIQINHAHETNTNMYRHKNRGLLLMEVATKNGFLTDVLYLAMYHYNDGKYRHALNLLEMARSAMYRPYVMYWDFNKYQYIQSMCGKTLNKKIKEAMACQITISINANVLELSLELKVIEKMKLPWIIVPARVLLHFLSFLCFYHLGCAQNEQSLLELQTLIQHVHARDKKHIDIAWQMLGICHQLYMQPHHALECYKVTYSLSTRIQEAALYRIQTLQNTL